MSAWAQPGFGVVRRPTYRWIGSTGIFPIGINWDLGTPPSDFDSALFDRTGTYAVGLVASVNNRRATIKNGSPTFLLNDATYALSQELVVDGSGSMKVRAGTLGSIQVRTTRVGVDGHGDILLSDNGKLTSQDFVLAASAGSTGSATIQGTGSLTASNDLMAGSGNSFMTIGQGGQVSVARDIVANNGHFLIQNELSTLMV